MPWVFHSSTLVSRFLSASFSVLLQCVAQGILKCLVQIQIELNPSPASYPSTETPIDAPRGEKKCAWRWHGAHFKLFARGWCNRHKIHSLLSPIIGNYLCQWYSHFVLAVNLDWCGLLRGLHFWIFLLLISVHKSASILQEFSSKWSPLLASRTSNREILRCPFLNWASHLVPFFTTNCIFSNFFLMVVALGVPSVLCFYHKINLIADDFGMTSHRKITYQFLHHRTR